MKDFKRSVKIVAIIPARGGSKSVPRKNIQDLLGVPLLTYSIDVALRCDFVTDVIVSTDDLEIANISKQYGSNIVLRPKSLAEDSSRDSGLLVHIFEVMGFSSEDLVVFLRPTHPIRNPATLRKAFELFDEKRSEYDSLRSLKPSNEIVFKTWGFDQMGEIVPAYNPAITTVDDPPNAPRQVLPSTFYQDGYVEVFPFSTPLTYSNTSGKRVLPFIVSEYSQDIDTFEELKSIENHLTNESFPEWFEIPKFK